LRTDPLISCVSPGLLMWLIPLLSAQLLAVLALLLNLTLRR
jgi:hypothetical protein